MEVTPRTVPEIIEAINDNFGFCVMWSPSHPDSIVLDDRVALKDLGDLILLLAMLAEAYEHGRYTRVL